MNATVNGRNVIITSKRGSRSFTVENGFSGGDRRTVSWTVYVAHDAATGEFVGCVKRDANGVAGPACAANAASWIKPAR